MASGLDATGLEIKRLADLLTEMKDEARGRIGDAVQLDGKNSAAGQLLELFAVQLAEVWELAQGLYDSFNRDTAEGTQLDNLCGLIGVVREPATSSFATLTITGTPATVVPQGTRYRVPNGPTFETAEAATIGGGGTVDVVVNAVETGPVTATSATITEAVDVVAGVSSVSNAADATPGQDVESDTQLRVRAQLSLSIVGAGPDQAIAARLLALDSVQQCIVISNRTLTTDAYGIPGKAFLSVVYPAQASNDEVFEAIWATMPAGILAHGDITGTATDSQGNEQPVAYSLATEVDIYVNVDVVAGPNFPGAAAVKTAVQDYINALNIGDDVRHYRLMCAVADLEDALDIDVQLKAGSAPGASDTANISIDVIEIARNSQVNTTVNIT